MSVTVANQLVTVVVSGQTAMISLAPRTQTLSLTPRVADIITAGTQGPAGVNEQEIEMDLLKRADNIEDSPSAGELTVYLAWAEDVGALDSEAKWKIKKRIIAVDGDLTETFADGDTNYDNIWDDHLTLSY